MVIASLTSLLLVFLITIFYKKTPLPAYRQLIYHPGYWLLQDKWGHNVQYEKINIRFQGGFFIVLMLTGENSKKELIIFKDQITQEQYRFLEWIKWIH
jgi:hypothetical protein